MPEGLTANKLRDRAERVRHQENAITFTLERHPKPIPIQQQWRFDLDKKEFIMIGEKPTYLDCEEAAILLQVTPETVRRYIKQGKIQAQRALEIKEIDDWFEDKLERGNYGVYIRRNLIVPPNKWLVPHEELCRFLREN